MAIALDNTSNSGFTSGTSHTFSHTINSATNNLILAGAVQNDQARTVSGITYNGGAMNFVATKSDAKAGGRLIYLYQLAGVATGAHNIVITADGTTAIGGIGLSYTGIDQTTPVEVSSTAIFTATPCQSSLTTITANDWAILLTAMNATVQFTAGANSTARTNNTTFLDTDFFDNNADIVSPGVYGMEVNNATVSAVSPAITVMAALKPSGAVASASYFPQLLTLNVG